MAAELNKEYLMIHGTILILCNTKDFKTIYSVYSLEQPSVY